MEQREIASISVEEYLNLRKKNQNLRLIKDVIEHILSKKKNGRMFNIVTATWNPITGCLYNCKYCWARELALTKLKNSQR